MNNEKSATRIDLELDLRTLRVVYRGMMAGYANALGEAGRLRRPETHWYLFAPLVRLLIGSHVRGKLRAVAARSVQLEAALDPERDAASRNWLSHVHESTHRVASSLPSRRLPSIFVVVPFILGLTPLLELLFDLAVPSYVWIVLALFLVAVAGLSSYDLFAAYRRKRELLLEDATKVDRQAPDVQQDHQGMGIRNVYRDEDELFTSLGIVKRREAELDRIFLVYSVILVNQAVYLIALVFNPSSAAVGWLLVAILVGMGLVLWLGPKVLLPKSRVWR